MDREQLEKLGFKFDEIETELVRVEGDNIPFTGVIIRHVRASYIHVASSENPELAWREAVEWATKQAHQLNLE